MGPRRHNAQRSRAASGGEGHRHIFPMTRRNTIGFVLAAAIGLGAIASLALYLFAPAVVDANQDPYSRLQRFGEVYELVRSKYVDKPDDGKLMGAAIRGMLRALDPHSSYVDGKSYAALQSMTNGEFGDVGVELTLRDGKLTVLSPIDDSSAARAGVRPGDVIAAIDGVPTEGMTLDQGRDKIRGEPNTRVRLAMIRGSRADISDLDLVRDQIKILSVRSHLEPDGVGYMRIAQFTETTAEGLREAMVKLRREAAPAEFKGYILDLRNDPGGFFDQAVETVNAFIDEGEVVSTRGRAPGTNRAFPARLGLNISAGRPVVVLINGATASSAEIVAGALQDLGRATIIGTRSFGKGTAQTTIPLGSNGALRMTTARFFTPSGKSIQATGVTPDIEVLEDVPNFLAKRYRTAGEASLKGHLAGFQAEAFGSQTYVPSDPEQDTQLKAARQILVEMK
jgi:carboxyl-terminal processing protease